MKNQMMKRWLRMLSFAFLLLSVTALIVPRSVAEGDFRSLFQEGIDLSRQQKHTEAIEKFEQAREAASHPNELVNALSRMGMSLMASGQEVEAMQVYKAALQHDDVAPHIRAGLLNNIGAAKLQSNDFAGAKEAYQQAVDLDADVSPIKHSSHLGLGRAHFATGEFEEADVQFDLVVGADDAMPVHKWGAVIWQALIQKNQGNTDKAADILQTVIDSDEAIDNHKQQARSILQKMGITPQESEETPS